MDCRRWISRFAFLVLSLVMLASVPLLAHTPADTSSIVAVRLVDRAPVCSTAKVKVPCHDWEPGHPYIAGDEILPKIGNAHGLTFKAEAASISDTTEPTWPQTIGSKVQDGPQTTGVLWTATDTISHHFIRVEFSDPHATGKESELTLANVTVITTPSNKAIKPAKDGDIQAGFQSQVLAFELSKDAVTPPGDTSVKVCFTNYTFTSKPTPVPNLCGDGKIYNDANIPDLVSDAKRALNNVVSTPKSSAEKDIFAGLSISVPSGGGETQGSGDLNINHNFAFPLVGQGIFGLEIKKGSSTNADPRHFTGGITARKTFLLHLKSSDLSNLMSAIESTSTDSNGPALSTIANLQKSFFRSIYFDNGLSYEGDISNGGIGNIGNVLYNADIFVNTAARPLTKQSGFFNFRVLPVGVEAGYNVSSNASTAPPPPSGTTPNGSYSLARLKSGATFILSSQTPYRTDNSARLDLELSVVNRYLFEKELIYDGKTKSYLSTGTGNKYWAQVALKILGGSIGRGSLSGRPGLRLGFERGSLPPVYAFTKVFTVSLIYETNDNNSQEIKLVDQK